jgi:hypothetical protein
MKKTFLFIAAILIPAIYTFQSCIKTTENSESVTINLMIQDKEFQDFCVLHNDFTAQAQFVQQGLPGGQRKAALERTKILSSNKNATSDDAIEMLSILGFSDLKQYSDFLTKYKQLYERVKLKFAHGEAATDEAARTLIFKAYGAYSKKLQWAFKRDRDGLLYAANKLSISSLNTLQLRACNCEFQDCNSNEEADLHAVHRDLNRDILNAGGLALAGAAGGSVIPGVGTAGGAIVMGALGLANALYNMYDATEQAAQKKCSCIKGHNPNCRC